ncbi:MAG: hypothetical protein BV456_11465 [Thermoplasmata archaeon M8B2D]|nr:MAG: hypothetical protein BV456_11465 [Thermoplasmata archaeon M8B2D]
MDLKEIQERNYQATVKRGLITAATTFDDFIDKIKEETLELIYSAEIDIRSGDIKYMFDELELSDIIITCFNMAKYYDIDIQKALEEKTLINETR